MGQNLAVYAEKPQSVPKGFEVGPDYGQPIPPGGIEPTFDPNLGFDAPRKERSKSQANVLR